MLNNLLIKQIILVELKANGHSFRLLIYKLLRVSKASSSLMQFLHYCFLGNVHDQSNIQETTFKSQTI